MQIPGDPHPHYSGRFRKELGSPLMRVARAPICRKPGKTGTLKSVVAEGCDSLQCVMNCVNRSNMAHSTLTILGSI